MTKGGNWDSVCPPLHNCIRFHRPMKFRWLLQMYRLLHHAKVIFSNVGSFVYLFFILVKRMICMNARKHNNYYRGSYLLWFGPWSCSASHKGYSSTLDVRLLIRALDSFQVNQQLVSIVGRWAFPEHCSIVGFMDLGQRGPCGTVFVSSVNSSLAHSSTHDGSRSHRAEFQFSVFPKSKDIFIAYSPSSWSRYHF